jgi:hypothetical protein
MKPRLVDFDEIFKDNSSLFFKKKPIIRTKIIKQDVNYEFNYNYLFNSLGLLCLVIGLYFLVARKREKKKMNIDFEHRIYKLKDIIKNNDEFIL